MCPLDSNFFSRNPSDTATKESEDEESEDEEELEGGDQGDDQAKAGDGSGSKSAPNEDEDDRSFEDVKKAVKNLGQDMDSVQLQRCCAHTLQLAVNDALKKAGNHFLEDLIGVARKAAKAARTAIWKPIFKKTGRGLIPSIDTVKSWSSTYNMLNRLLEVCF